MRQHPVGPTRLVLALAGASLFASACGAPDGTTAPRSGAERTWSATSGDDDAPRLVVGELALPALPVTVDADEPALEPLVREANTLVARPLAVPEDSLDAPGFRRWIEEQYRPYVAAQTETIRALWDALRALQSDDAAVRVVGRAVVGASLLVVASRLATIPIPAAVRDDAQLRLSLRDALVRTSSAIATRAVQALGACASEAVGSADPSVEDWRLDCDHRASEAQSLPRPLEP